MGLLSCKHLLLEASLALFLEQLYTDKRSQNEAFSITVTSTIQIMAWNALKIFKYCFSLFYKSINWQAWIVISVTPSGKVISIFRHRKWPKCYLKSVWKVIILFWKLSMVSTLGHIQFLVPRKIIPWFRRYRNEKFNTHNHWNIQLSQWQILIQRSGLVQQYTVPFNNSPTRLDLWIILNLKEFSFLCNKLLYWFKQPGGGLLQTSLTT